MDIIFLISITVILLILYKNFDKYAKNLLGNRDRIVKEEQQKREELFEASNELSKKGIEVQEETNKLLKEVIELLKKEKKKYE